MSITTHFVDGPFVEIRDSQSDSVCVKFIDRDTKDIVHSGVIQSNQWIRCNRRWFTNWEVNIKGSDGREHVHIFDLEGKRVLIWFDSRFLGDTLGWMPFVDQFRQIKKCKVFCSTFWNHLFKDSYPEIEFVEPGKVVYDLYASYVIGDYDGDNFKNKEEWRTIPLQKIASDMLGLPYECIKPKITIPNKDRNIKEKYVCISIHSTLQGKYWNYPKGWQIIVNYLNGIGYKVVQISKEGKWFRGNKIPNKTINKTGDISLQDRMVDLKHADMYIGVSSGLSWLSWAIGTPTIIISGITEPFCEPSYGVDRIFNHEACHGCLNDSSLLFDRNNWGWCPMDKDFECSKRITPEMVIEKIDKILLSNNDAKNA